MRELTCLKHKLNKEAIILEAIWIEKAVQKTCIKQKYAIKPQFGRGLARRQTIVAPERGQRQVPCRRDASAAQQ